MHDPAGPEIIRLRDVSRAFPSGDGQVWALREVFLEARAGEIVALTGPSGSGKSTLLNLVAGLDKPTSGEITVLGQPLNGLGERALTAFRARSLGLVFQDAHLLPGLSALENVIVARLPWDRRSRLEPASRSLLAAVGLAHRMDFPPSRLSGGERQRVAIARALVGRPRLLLADEPTGNLDSGTTEEILTLLEELRRELGLSLVVATHDAAVAAVANRVVRLAGGRIEGESRMLPNTPIDVHTLE